MIASRGWWKSGTSKIYLNITSELQILNGFEIVNSSPIAK